MSRTIFECTVCGDQMRSPLGHKHDFKRAPTREIEVVPASVVVTDEMVEKACDLYAWEVDFGMKRAMRMVLENFKEALVSSPSFSELADSEDER